MQSKFDMRTNPCYQVDWSNAASGKRVSATKRRVRWRFGFSDKESIAKGLSGIECRGEEHEVVLVWSLTSGKRLVIADGREVHFSKGSRTDGQFETSWTMAGGHIIKLIAHAAPPLFETPGFRQFDLLLDGCSYFDMCKIYELGTRKSNKVAHLARAPQSEAYNNYSFAQPSQPENEEMDQSTRSEPEPTKPPSSTPTKSAPRRAESAPAPVVDFLSDPATPGQDYLDTAAPVATFQTTPQAAIVDAFAPVEATPAPPSFHHVSNQILSHYTPPTSAAPTTHLALANESHTHHVPPTPQQQQMYHQAPPQQQQQQYYPQTLQNAYQYQQPAYNTQQSYYHQQQQNQYAQQPELQPVTPDSSSVGSYERDSLSPVVPSMQPLSLVELDATEPVSEMERAFKSLVNLDDLNESLKTPEQVKFQEKKIKNQPIGSKPLPPTAPVWHLGVKPKLGDIKEHTPSKAAPTKEIMRTHAFDPAAVHAGMMVVYGAAPAGIPPSSGFGAGMHHPSQYQQQQYQQQPMYYAH